MTMRSTTPMLFCDGCDAATTRSERGWRAYVRIDDDESAAVEVLCPCCAEAAVGEDEAS
jgi:hypothetical protein